MSKKVNLLAKSSLFYLVATFIGQGASFLGTVVFTRVMSQTDYGRYSTYYAFVPILTVIVGANLYYSINNAYIDHKNRIKEYRKSVLFLSSMIFMLILLCSLIINRLSGVNISSLIVICCIVHGYSFFVLNYGIYSANMENDYKEKVWLLILPNILQFTVAFVCVLESHGDTYVARVVGSTLGVFICGCIVYLRLLHVDGNLIVTEDWKYAISISVPSIVMSLSYIVMQQSDKVMITLWIGEDATAVYSVIYYISYIAIAVDQSIRPVRQAWIFNRLGDGDLTGIKGVQKWYIFIIMFIVNGSLMIAPEIIKIIAPTSYWSFEYVAPFVFSACMMSLYQFYMEVGLFYKKNRLLSVCTLIAAAMNVALNSIFIPSYGAIAATYTTGVAYLILFVLSWAVVNDNIRNLYDHKIFGAFIVISVVLCIVFLLIYKNLLFRILIYGSVFLLMGMYALKYRKEIRSYLWRK